ncbi:hypothetical protein F8M41_005524 [Gigaspora margarita]|uniref:Uncharacterized protein n=1 Tax=Gigaspora margarita TaxID=4874 RepID=A0A8H4AXF2_GIGMA|nr:hypothetical protein F8M41_005524 [Gigaspora margarita]
MTVAYSKIVNQIQTIDAVPLPLVIAKDKHDPNNYIVKSQWYGFGHDGDEKIKHMITCKDKSVKVKKHTHQNKFSDYEAHYEIKVPENADIVLCERNMRTSDNEFLGFSTFSFKHTSQK